MKQHEREYFISRIRSGKIILNKDDIKLTIVTPTIDDELEINSAYIEAYEESINDGCMTIDENVQWMIKNKLWSEEEEEKIEGIEKDIENIKVKLFQERNNAQIKAAGKGLLKASRKSLVKLLAKKNTYYSNTSECIANVAKCYAMIKRCTFFNGDLYSFDDLSVDYIVDYYYKNILDETKVRELARNDPWSNIWLYCGKDINKLFSNKDRELSVDQKNIFVWSRLYDNIAESIDCPDDEVINDDDILDGWFILQKRKRELEKKESDMEQSLSSNIANKQEVFLMSSSKEEAIKNNKINNAGIQMVKRERFNQIKREGKVDQLKLKDEQLKIRTKVTQGFKNKVGG